MRWQFRGLLRLSLVALLAASLAAVTVCRAAPLEAAQATSGREVEAVVRYLEAGGRVPGWAASPSVSAALAQEAQRNGLAGVAASAASERLPPAGKSLWAALRLARMLARGAIAPTSVEPSWTIPVPEFNRDATLRILVLLDDPLPWLRGLAPEDDGYRRLQQALAAYDAIARQGGWPVIAAGPRLALGMSGDRVATLRARLAIEGDLAPGTPAGSVFDAETQDAVRRFQMRHGFSADGRVGPDTLAAMNVDARQRYRQIAAALERWRWLPHRLPRERVMVNAAAARLTLVADGSPVLELRTIVGTPRRPTPVLMATITSLLFNPPWNIPAAIAAHEIRPHARRDPAYLRRERIVAVEGGRLRQLPGDKNALGRLKFEMPNPLDIYLHDTPTKDLFNRARRFFSHGCVRVEHPEALALQLLRHDPAWTNEAIAGAMAAGTTRREPIDPTVPVFVIYVTAAVEAEGAVAFFGDIYHRDPPLIDALFRATPAPSRGVAQAAGGWPHRP